MSLWQPATPTNDGTNEGIDIDPTAVRHVQALEILTGRSTDDLLNEAVNHLRQILVPSTRQPRPPGPAASRRRSPDGSRDQRATP